MAGVADIERVLSRLRIEVAERYPRRIVARCSSGEHDDEHPSWSIVTQGDRVGLHRCHSCKWGGSLVDLVMKVRDVGFPAAKEWLGEVLGGEGERIPVDEIRVVVRSPLVRFRLPPEVAFDALDRWPATARKYVSDPPPAGRGIPEWQVTRWRVGYAVFGRLAGRIVFVTYDPQWRPTNYTARSFARDPKRYLNASEVEGPDFSYLFGEAHWPPVTARRVPVIVTEGAIDALAVERAVEHVHPLLRPQIAALNGSNVMPIHFAKLATFARAVILTDPDPAGDQAATVLTAGLVRRMPVDRVRLPEGKDAASIASQELRRWIGFDLV